MTNRLRAAMLLVWALYVMAAASACEWPGPSASVVSGDDDQSPEIAFGDGTWTMRVDREWDRGSGGTRFPSDPLDETDYVPVDNGASYLITVTLSTGEVRIRGVGDPPLVGSRNVAYVGQIFYDLTEGTFAGGRFVVWPLDDTLQAELTIYGSGVPIISSERGRLIRSTEASTLFVPWCR